MKIENKKFTDWHLYFGQPVQVLFEDEYGRYTVERKGTLSWSQEHDDFTYILYELENNDFFDECDFEWRLILRPLSDMTEEEYHHTAFCVSKEPNDFMREANNTNYLLKQGFDLFGLHEAGLCLYKEDLTKTT